MHKIVFLLSYLLLAPHVFSADTELNADVVQRRQKMMESMGRRGMLILFSADIVRYSGDVYYEFRQDSNLYYLTGLDQPNITLVLMPQNESMREILFLPARNFERELWTGDMLSPKEASAISGIDTIWAATEFDLFINSILSGNPYRSTNPSEYEKFLVDLQGSIADIFLLLNTRPGLEKTRMKELKFSDHLRDQFPEIQIKDVSVILHQLRMIKSSYEIRQLTEAIDITTTALREAMKNIHPQIWEYEVEAIIEYVFKSNNPLDWAFPSIVASGPNATKLHYQKSLRQAGKDELMLMDVGAAVNYYTADITRTVPVEGKFTPKQTTIYQLVLDAQKAAIEVVKPGASLRTINQASIKVLKDGLHRLGLITNKDSDQYRAFFPHGTSHFLGLDVHDVSHGERLKPNMILTIEPGIYVRKDSAERLVRHGAGKKDLEKVGPAIEKFMGIGVRIEDDVLVTDDSYKLLSDNAPRDIADIESIMMGSR